MKPGTIALFALLPLVAASGCRDKQAPPPEPTPTSPAFAGTTAPTCETDVDCGDGEGCVAGLCKRQEVAPKAARLAADEKCPTAEECVPPQAIESGKEAIHPPGKTAVARPKLPPARSDCKSDDDCALSNLRNCCSGCSTGAYSRDWLDEVQEICRSVTGDCPLNRCRRQKGGYVAKCFDGSCHKVEPDATGPLIPE